MTDLKKIFSLSLLAGLIALIVLAYLALSPLYIYTNNPKGGAEECLKFMNWFNKITLLFYVVLIFISNLIYKKDGKGIFLFYGWLFFTIAVLFSYIHISEEYFHFKQDNDLWQGEFSVAGFVGIGLSVIAGIAALINYIILKQVFKK